MKEVPPGRSTRMALPSATSTWRSVAKQGRPPIRIAAGHLEKEQALDNALNEYCQLREQGNALSASQFCSRYPSYRQSLRRLIDVHDAMESQPGLEEENWPELFSEFLGYEIIHELGVGAIARVYLAAETALGGRLVAIKVSQQGGDEAELLGKLTHPNIVPVFSVKHDEETDMTAVCMPYHGSATLADLLEIGFEAGKPPVKAGVILDAARQREQVVEFVDGTAQQSNVDRVLLRANYVDGVARLGIQMADALDYTHERGILHRDLKPSNVLLTPDGVPMLLDFNLASDIATGAQRLGGTLPYMPPEQILDVHLRPGEADLAGDPRSDIFSLGVILYELLTGTLPFGDPPAAVAPRQAAEEYLALQQQDPPALRDLNPAVSSELASLVHRCLSLDPSRRPASAADFVSELKKYFSRRRRAGRWTSRHRGLVAVFLLLFMSQGSAIAWHLATRPTYAVRQYLAGITDISHGQYTEAVEHFDQVIKLDENSVPFRFARGIAFQRMGNHKQAEIDLAIAATSTNDPLIMECCAFSQMKMWTSAADPRVSARTMYVRMSEISELSAEHELNWAFANYDIRPVPPLVISRCNEALVKRPDWQEAYYLRALGHYASAQQALKSRSDAAQEGRLNTAVQNARDDFERAIRLGPPSGRLFADAAEAYMIPNANPPSARLQELLRLAALHGAPRLLFTSYGDTHGWSSEPWFQEILSSYSHHSRVSQEPTYSEVFLTPPNVDLIDAQLNAYRVQLTSAP